MFFGRRRRVVKKELCFLGGVAKQCRFSGAAGELPKSNVFGAPRGQCQKVAFFERRCQGVTYSPKNIVFEGAAAKVTFLRRRGGIAKK